MKLGDIDAVKHLSKVIGADAAVCRCGDIVDDGERHDKGELSCTPCGQAWAGGNNPFLPPEVIF